MENFDVVALGELLIDFTYDSISKQGNDLFEANPGGAPCNVLAMLQKLGKRTSFIGKVGKDSFGEKLKQALIEQGINTDELKEDSHVPTTLAFVHTAPDGDRSFSFYRNPGADMMLRENEVNEELIRHTKIFHFGSLSMTESNLEKATRKAIEAAKKAGILISFDPNWRPLLWENPDIAKEKILFGISKCDILKVSDDEILFVSGESNIEEGIRYIRNKYKVPLICVSMGKKGSKVFYRDLEVEEKPFLQADTIETTGAGDTFCACILNTVLECGIEKMGEKELRDMLLFANAAASIITTKKGALRVMPDRDEIEKMVQEEFHPVYRR